MRKIILDKEIEEQDIREEIREIKEKLEKIEKTLNTIVEVMKGGKR